ncbi:shikimate kinase [Geomonas limicola]|uniref:Shikimate kinase n=1 Tax=Geomonas limicola TaxID=2740186 RepID=A0A6V8N7D1_9BACT|nr:shikimate kinase [Geomonas limicola]GFO67737.1 shikimate kinase [Geomonas limicola]
MSRVTMIGMPGSGKSAVGRLVAERLGWQFLDTDKVIEARRGVLLQQLIDRVGESAFLEIEEETLVDVEFPDCCVIAPGGSAIYSEAGMQRLASLSTVVFLDAPIAEVREHIAGQAPRGIIGLTDAGSLEALLAIRLPLYRHWAHLCIHCSEATAESEADQVLAQLQAYWHKD